MKLARTLLTRWVENTVEGSILRLSKAQRRALDLIAVNASPFPCSDKTLSSLEGRGLIEFATRRLPGFPPVTVREPYMPITIHVAWCRVCAAETPEVE